MWMSFIAAAGWLTFVPLGHQTVERRTGKARNHYDTLGMMRGKSALIRVLALRLVSVALPSEHGSKLRSSTHSPPNGSYMV